MGKIKVCIACQKPKELSEFYKHPQMADGHLNRCKECQQINTRYNYRKNREKRIAYERKRELDPERKSKKREYQRRMRLNNPEKYKAWNKVSNAIRDGKLKKSACEKCGNKKSQAHHEDYSKPLEVRWLCRSCHIIEHGKVPY